MKKSKTRSQVSVLTVKSEVKDEVYEPPLDALNIKLFSINVPDEEPKHLDIKITFFDQLLLSGVVISSNGREPSKERAIARGQMYYDPSDHEKMGLFANNPLIVKIKPFECIKYNLSETIISSHDTSSQTKTKSESAVNQTANVYCCNVDILPVFVDTDKLFIRKRLAPMIPRSVLDTKSWDNLPLITLSVKAHRNPENIRHHNIFKTANFLKFTLIGCYNMKIPHDESAIYTAATKLPSCNEKGATVIIYNQGHKVPKRFDNMKFNPHWESLRSCNDVFTKGDEKFTSKFEELHNEENINLSYYLRDLPQCYTTIWASFHRTLLMQPSEIWLTEYLRQYKWPFEVQVSGDIYNYNMMGFLDLFQLLYPGENTARLVVPLQWIDAESMMQKCGCELFLATEDRASSAIGAIQKPSKATTESVPTSTNTEMTLPRSTGSDENNAFAIVEVVLGRPLRKPVIPPHIHKSEIKDMLLEMELVSAKRECTGRGQLDRDWQATVHSAANSLRRIPYYGLTDFCMIDRQLSGTRTRVELATSFWQDAAIYTNNNFVVKDFLHSDKSFEEMIMMTHACMIRLTNETLGTVDNRQKVNLLLRAARHARHLQDVPHAVDLYFQLVAENKRDADMWRELATCLKDIDRDWANVCINKSLALNPRHPLSLISKACIVFEEDPDKAELFFVALLAFYPFWLPLWVAASAFYLHRQLFHVSNHIMEHVKKMLAENMAEEMNFPRAWEHELGDWWDSTPLLPGTNLYYNAADLLLRLRGIALAEVCIARALMEAGESAIYYHLLALCCRLKEDYDNALCHLNDGIEKFGEINYLKSLEGECHHKKKNVSAAMMSLEKSMSKSGPYMTLLSLPHRDPQRCHSTLVDLLRRQPNAYAWMALAEYWMMRSTIGEGGDASVTEEQVSATTYAIACGVQALKWDRQAGSAWNMLSRIVRPSARRLYCRKMAAMCDHALEDEHSEFSTESQQSLCYRLGKALRECRCAMCKNLTLQCRIYKINNM